jgi:tripartite ATP-independent transporter DctM subunit
MVVLIVFLGTGAPVALVMAGSGIAGLLMLRGLPTVNAVLAATPFDATAAFSLVVIPMFVLLGSFATRAGVADDVFRLGQKLLGRLPGGLAMAAVAACAAFGAVSGSSNAMVASIGPAAVDQMRRYNYKPGFAAGVIASAGTLAIMIPPSVTLVLYAIITRESIGACLLAGIVPGILCAILYVLTIGTIGLRRPDLVGRAKDGRALPVPDGGNGSGPVRWSDFTSVLKIAVLFLVVMGGIYGGIFTATEAAAVGAAVALLMLVATHWRSGPRPLGKAVFQSMLESANISSFIFIIVVGASIFAFFLVSAGVPSAFAIWAVNLDVPPILIVGLLVLAIIPLGMFLDPISIMLIVLPLAHPVVVELGFSGVWFAVIVTQAIEIGLVTPPVGINVFIVAGAAKVSAEETYAGIMWFLPTQFLTLIILFLFPSLSTWLPQLMRG